MIYSDLYHLLLKISWFIVDLHIENGDFPGRKLLVYQYDMGIEWGKTSTNKSLTWITGIVFVRLLASAQKQHGFHGGDHWGYGWLVGGLAIQPVVFHHEKIGINEWVNWVIAVQYWDIVDLPIDNWRFHPKLAYIPTYGGYNPMIIAMVMTGCWFGTWLLLGMPSSQLTNFIIFQRGRYTTSWGNHYSENHPTVLSG